MTLSLLPLSWAHCPLKTPEQRARVPEAHRSCDCLMLAPVIVNVADPIMHLTERSKAFIPQSRRVNGDNPGVIPSKTPGRKIHHVLSSAILWAQRLVGASSWHWDAVVQENCLSPSNQEGDVLHTPGCFCWCARYMGKKSHRSSGGKTQSPKMRGQICIEPSPTAGKTPCIHCFN